MIPIQFFCLYGYHQNMMTNSNTGNNYGYHQNMMPNTSMNSNSVAGRAEQQLHSDEIRSFNQQIAQHPEGLDPKFTRHVTGKTRHLRLC